MLLLLLLVLFVQETRYVYPHIIIHHLFQAKDDILELKPKRIYTKRVESERYRTIFETFFFLLNLYII